MYFLRPIQPRNFHHFFHLFNSIKNRGGYQSTFLNSFLILGHICAFQTYCRSLGQPLLFIKFCSSDASNQFLTKKSASQNYFFFSVFYEPPETRKTYFFFVPNKGGKTFSLIYLFLVHIFAPKLSNRTSPKEDRRNRTKIPTKR